MCNGATATARNCTFHYKFHTKPESYLEHFNSIIDASFFYILNWCLTLQISLETTFVFRTFLTFMQRSKTFCVCYMSGITISHETRLVLEHCNSIIDASFFYILASHYNFTRNLTRIRIFQLHNWCFILSSDPLFMCRYTWWDHYACLALQFHTKLDSLVLEYFNSITSTRPYPIGEHPTFILIYLRIDSWHCFPF